MGTSQPNPGRIEDALEALLRQGKDVLYLSLIHILPREELMV